jgi:succinoglycan biosynthesis transport protein ExoP
VLVRHRVLSILIALAGFAATFAHGEGVVLSIAMGASLGMVIAFGLDTIVNTITRSQDITRRFRLPVLGQVPQASHEPSPLVSAPTSPGFREAFQALTASLVVPDRVGPRFIAVTSARPLEGKTMTTCHLGRAFTAAGSHVLLVDADMDQPGLWRMLGKEETLGLSQVLRGHSRIRDAIHRTEDARLCIMTSGPPASDSAELLSSERMKQMIASLRRSPFDWVLIDTPPLLKVRDATVLTPLIDGVLLVVRAGRTRPSTLHHALDTLERSRITGVVLNRVRTGRQ